MKRQQLVDGEVLNKQPDRSSGSVDLTEVLASDEDDDVESPSPGRKNSKDRIPYYTEYKKGFCTSRHGTFWVFMTILMIFVIIKRGSRKLEILRRPPLEKYERLWPFEGPRVFARPQALEWWYNIHREHIHQIKRNDANYDLVFLGDSITEGWKKGAVSSDVETPASIWAEMFGNYTTLNLGISGDKAEDLGWRLQNGIVEGEFQLPEEITLRPTSQGTPSPTASPTRQVQQTESTQDTTPSEDTKALPLTTDSNSGLVVLSGTDGNRRRLLVRTVAPNHARHLNSLEHVVHLEKGPLASVKLFVLLIGTNDLSMGEDAAHVLDEIISIVLYLRTKMPWASILMLNLFPRGPDWPPDGEHTSERWGLSNKYYEDITYINSHLRNMVHHPHRHPLQDIEDKVDSIFSSADGVRPRGHKKRTGVFHIDCNEDLLKLDAANNAYILRTIMGDFLHPTTEGYRRWGKCIKPTIEKIFEMQSEDNL